MKKFKKFLTMGLAAMMAVSAMSVSAFAKNPIYDTEGEVIGYEITTDDVDDVNIGIDLAAGLPMSYSLLSSPPGYSTNLKNLTSQDYSEAISLTAGNLGYTSTWTGSASKCGTRFYGITDMSKLTLKIYKVSSSGSTVLTSSATPSANSLGYVWVSLNSSDHYYMLISNTASFSQKGTVIITNDPSSYGLLTGN